MTARSRSRRRPRKTVFLLPVLAVVIAVLVVRSHVGGSGGGSYAVDPSAFSPGACMSYAPTSGNRHITVFLDAGHGGVDPGAVGTTESGATIYEADETLPVELGTAKILRAEGFRVVVSRTRQSSVVRLNAQEESGGVLTLRGAHDDVARVTSVRTAQMRKSSSASTSTRRPRHRPPAVSPRTTRHGRSGRKASSSPPSCSAMSCGR